LFHTSTSDITHQQQFTTVLEFNNMGLKINGTIKQYIKAKEFGFIAPDDGSKDVLVELRDFKSVRYTFRALEKNTDDFTGCHDFD